jgi:hypothetical protein
MCIIPLVLASQLDMYIASGLWTTFSQVVGAQFPLLLMILCFDIAGRTIYFSHAYTAITATFSERQPLVSTFVGPPNLRILRIYHLCFLLVCPVSDASRVVVQTEKSSLAFQGISVPRFIQFGRADVPCHARIIAKFVISRPSCTWNFSPPTFFWILNTFQTVGILYIAPDAITSECTTIKYKWIAQLSIQPKFCRYDRWGCIDVVVG